MPAMTREDALDIMSRLDGEKVIFRTYAQEVIAAAMAGEEYGTTFIHRSYFDEIGEDGNFAVLDYLPGGLHRWQDIVVLRRLAY